MSFPDWKQALESVTADHERNAYLRAIAGFLRHCKSVHAPATIILAKQYIEACEKQDNCRLELLRSALRWFFKAADGAPARAVEVAVPALRRTQEAPVAARDLGGADWERDLIAALRRKGMLWRTEQTYRLWAQRFAARLDGRSPYAATGEDVSAFLSRIAVEQRASPSTQKQALNALVFFLQEGLKRDLGQFDFKRARTRQTVPIVLTQAECRKLFSELGGTTRLMAELMYGAGLRLMVA